MTQERLAQHLLGELCDRERGRLPPLCSGIESRGMAWFLVSMIVVLLAWALWPLVSLRSYRGHQSEQEFVELEYSGLPLAVDLASIPPARYRKRRSARRVTSHRGLPAQ